MINPHLDFLLSVLYDHSALAQEHVADLRRSGLTKETIAVQKIRSVPPSMIAQLLGFEIVAVRSAMLIPFPAPAGGFMDHVRMKVFPPITTRSGNTIKYLQPRSSATRLFFPLAAIREAVTSSSPLWLIEGEKKALAVAQLGLPAVGFCGIEGWHVAGARDLSADCHYLQLRDRVVELVPDADIATNPNVHRGVLRFAEALDRAGARVRLVKLPVEGAA
jgi:hypothetical protein